jgi:hypothetical protein
MFNASLRSTLSYYLSSSGVNGSQTKSGKNHFYRNMQSYSKDRELQTISTDSRFRDIQPRSPKKVYSPH